MLANGLAFKWLPGLFLLGSIAVVAAILKRQGSRWVLAGVLLLKNAIPPPSFMRRAKD